jgi:hypothetical protein
MAYICTLDGFDELVTLFAKNGYLLENDLSNDLLILNIGEEDDLVEWDVLSDELKTAVDDFILKHELKF